MNLGLSGKNSLITGSSSGLGFAAAKILLAENVNTIINGRNEEKLKISVENLKTETGKMPLFLSGDVTDHEFPERLVEFVNNNFSCLDILITNSGGPPPGQFEEFSDENWQYAVECRFCPTYGLYDHFYPYCASLKHHQC